MTDNFKVNVYRNCNLLHNDYVFNWYGELDYELVCGYDTKTGEPSTGKYIYITNMSNFIKDFKKTNVTTYHPTVFWRLDKEDGTFCIGQIVIDSNM